MPKEIDCSVCNGAGYLPIQFSDMLDGMCTCNNGKITIYTEEELQEAIDQENEECAEAIRARIESNI